MTDTDLIVAQINRGRCLLAAGRLGAPVRVRMHPLDVAAIRAQYTRGSDRSWTKPMSIMGCQIVGDCGVLRERPVVEYDE